MAGKKYYAVRRGRETGIFPDWDACRALVEGYPEAEFKGFVRLEDARAYLGKDAHDKKEEAGGKLCGKVQQEKTEWKKSGHPGKAEAKVCPKPDTLLAYVDGSYDNSLKKYAFGCVFILPDGRVMTKNGNGNNPQSLRHRNVTGEMLGAMYAVRVAMVSGFSKIEIRYDYEGIEKWVTGAWRSKTELTQKYAGSMQQWGEQITIVFTKVAAHSNVYYNEMADRTAKAGLREGEGIPKVCSIEEMQKMAEENSGGYGTDQIK